MNEILLYFPEEIEKELKRFDLKDLEEIRLRNNNPIFLKIGQDEIKIEYIMTQDILLKILQKICNNSIYTYQNQICNRLYYY